MIFSDIFFTFVEFLVAFDRFVQRKKYFMSPKSELAITKKILSDWNIFFYRVLKISILELLSDFDMFLL